MPRSPRDLRVLVGLAILVLPALAVSGVRVLPGKDAALGRPSAGRHLPVPVPCDEAVQELQLTANMAQTFTDSTAGESQVDAYACQPGWVETGPEHVYVLTATEDLILDVGLAGNVPNDHDLVLLSGCDSEDCLVQANTELSAELTADTTVYLVVDGYDGTEGEYTLNLETRSIGIPASICEGDAVPVAIDTGANVAYDETLHDRDNLVSIYDCAPYTVRGGELWFELTVAGADTVGDDEIVSVAIAATTFVPTLDLALWVFDDCGPDAQCLAFIDETTAGGEEMLEWTNPDPEPRTVYLAVDCIRRPDDADSGAFRIEFTTGSFGIPESICEGGAVPIAVDEGYGEEFSDTLHERPNLISVDVCAPVIVGGGEVWYELTIAGAQDMGDFNRVVRTTMLVTTGSSTLDLALWIYDGCGPDAQCLDFADESAAGGNEALAWDNTETEEQTVYLAVDCVLPPGDAAAGAFDLVFTTEVAVEKRSLRGVRNIFR